MTDNPTPNDIALLREALKLATDALANYAEPSGYTDNYGDSYTASDDPHPGILAKRTLEQIAALAPGQHDGAAGEGRRPLSRVAWLTDGQPAPTEQARAEGDVPADVRRLVIAARIVTDAGMMDEEERELFDAAEAFSSRVPYEDEPAYTEPLLRSRGACIVCADEERQLLNGRCSACQRLAAAGDDAVGGGDE